MSEVLIAFVCECNKNALESGSTWEEVDQKHGCVTNAPRLIRTLGRCLDIPRKAITSKILFAIRLMLCNNTMLAIYVMISLNDNYYLFLVFIYKVTKRLLREGQKLNEEWKENWEFCRRRWRIRHANRQNTTIEYREISTALSNYNSFEKLNRQMHASQSTV